VQSARNDTDDVVALVEQPDDTGSTPLATVARADIQEFTARVSARIYPTNQVHTSVGALNAGFLKVGLDAGYPIRSRRINCRRQRYDRKTISLKPVVATT